MRCKDMPKEPRTCQIIICMKCKNSGGTMVLKDGYYEHPSCKRPINPDFLKRQRSEQAEFKRALEAGEIKCQLCDEQPATGILRNRLNGNQLLACKSCMDYVSSQAEKTEPDPAEALSP